MWPPMQQHSLQLGEHLMRSQMEVGAAQMLEAILSSNEGQHNSSSKHPKRHHKPHIAE